METIEQQPLQLAGEPGGQPAGPSLFGAMTNTLGEMIDGIAAICRMEASLAACKAELVDQARRWSEITEAAGTAPASAATSSTVTSSAATSSATGWSPEVRARRVLVTELACALRIPERTAETLISDSQALLNVLPATLTALTTGTISWRHAHTLIDHATALTPEHAAVFETTVLPFAETLTVTKFDRKARTARELMDPTTIDTRHTHAVEQRFIDLQPGRDGMAWLSAFLPATEAHGIYNRLTDIALAQQSPTEPRTLTQLRADACVELLLDGELPADTTADGRGAGGTNDTAGGPVRAGTGGASGSTSTSGTPGTSGTSGTPGTPGTPGKLGSRRTTGIRPRILVTVPVMTLLGHSDEPAILEGYGPIDTATALELAACAPSFTRLLTHPETGAVLSVGRDSYTVPADLRTWLRVRDGTCRFPGCSRAARNCDIDHTKDWQFGHGTNHDNLAHLCPAHHHLKHQTAWAVRQTGGGVLEWTSPTGHVYSSEPDRQLAPAVTLN